MKCSLQDNSNSFITLDHLSIFLLLFADDAVIFSETEEGLQSLIDSFEQYCIIWKLTVNITKTKVMVFRGGGTLRHNVRWYYAGAVYGEFGRHPLQIVRTIRMIKYFLKMFAEKAPIVFFYNVI